MTRATWHHNSAHTWILRYPGGAPLAMVEWDGAGAYDWWLTGGTRQRVLSLYAAQRAARRALRKYSL